MIRIGTDKKSSHRASIGIFFCGESIEYGFDLTHSIKEAKDLANKINHDSNILRDLVKNLLKLEDYYIWIPNTGIFSILWLTDFNEKGLSTYLKSYEPIDDKDCYFKVLKVYESDALSIDKICEILVDLVHLMRK